MEAAKNEMGDTDYNNYLIPMAKNHLSNFYPKLSRLHLKSTVAVLEASTDLATETSTILAVLGKVLIWPRIVAVLDTSTD